MQYLMCDINPLISHKPLQKYKLLKMFVWTQQAPTSASRNITLLVKIKTYGSPIRSFF